MSLEKYKWPISTFLALVAIIVPVILYLSTVPEKALTYQVISKSDLIGSLESIESIEIKVKGEVVDKASIYLLAIRNSGSEPIKASDFDRPMFIKYADDTKIISVQIKKTNPGNLSIAHKINGNAISIAPFLLNPEDEFVVEVLSTSEEYPVLDSRIAGVTKVDEVLPQDESMYKKGKTLLLTFLLFTFYARAFAQATRSRGLSRVLNAVLGLTCVFSAFSIGRIELFFESNSSLTYLGVFLTIGVGILLTITEGRSNNFRQSSSTATDD